MAYCTAFTIKNGENAKCPELQRKLSKIQVGDVLLVHEISRLSRSVKDLLPIVESNKKGGASPKSLNESRLYASSENTMNEFLLNIFGSLAQLERGLTLQRQREGIEIANREGKFKGRKLEVTLAEKRQRKPYKLLSGIKKVSLYDTYICKALSIATGTLYRLLERESLR